MEIDSKIRRFESQGQNTPSVFPREPKIGSNNQKVQKTRFHSTSYE